MVGWLGVCDKGPQVGLYVHWGKKAHKCVWIVVKRLGTAAPQWFLGQNHAQGSSKLLWVSTDWPWYELGATKEIPSLLSMQVWPSWWLKYFLMFFGLLTSLFQQWQVICAAVCFWYYCEKTRIILFKSPVGVLTVKDSCNTCLFLAEELLSISQRVTVCLHKQLWSSSNYWRKGCIKLFKNPFW